MQLAINTLVVIILGLVIMGGGIALVYNIVDTVDDVPTQVNDQIRRELEARLIGSEKIAVLENVRAIDRGDSTVYYVGVQNILNVANETFVVQPPELLQPESCPSTCPEVETLQAPFTLDRFESQTFIVLATVENSVAPGEYQYNIDVHNSTDMYARIILNLKVN